MDLPADKRDGVLTGAAETDGVEHELDADEPLELTDAGRRAMQSLSAGLSRGRNAS